MRWRLVRTPAMAGAWNMAIDEAMLLTHAAGLIPPTLRFYQWSPPTVSLGLLQPYDAINEQACQQLGFDIVRRPSGGGAVLHQHEVTYAVVVDGRLCPYGSSVLATYRWLAEGLIAGLRFLGVSASLPEGTNEPAPSAAFCFVRLTGADLEVSGRKLGGSAQARRRYFLLQHGSLPLRLDNTAIAQLFGTQDTHSFTCVEEAAGRKVEPDEFADALVRGFETALVVTFYVGELTEVEWQLAELLVAGKYGMESWTKERKVAPTLHQQVTDLLRRAQQRWNCDGSSAVTGGHLS